MLRLIAEQEAGRLAKQGTYGRHHRRNNSVTSEPTLKDVGLSRMDSQRAQMVADNNEKVCSTRRAENVESRP